MNAPAEREIMEVDVLFVGAGPATLASAYHLMQTCAARGIDAPSVLVIEKSAEVGDHMLSGSVIAFGNAIAIPSFTSLYSKACRADQAGELMGQSQAMATTGRIVGPVAGGYLMQTLSPGAPFVVAGAMMLAALVMFHVARGALVAREVEAPAGRPAEGRDLCFGRSACPRRPPA